uniref:Uncharacterized protein n=1 Tax=viral metagenome TaxID=1070528 RepID=A0A6H1Z5P7_9ZZZZ
MRNIIVEQLDKSTELLGYFAGTVAIDQSDRSYTAATIGDTFAVGDTAVITDAVQTLSNGTFILSSVATGAIIVAGPAIGADDASDAIVINQQVPGVYKEVGGFAKLTGTINCSGNAIIYIDQSGDAVYTDYTSSWAVTGGTALAYEVDVLHPFAKMRIQNNGAVQTTMRAYLNGRKVS